MIDKEYKITIINEGAKKLLGLRQKKLSGKDLRKIITIFKKNKKIPVSKWPINKTLTNGAVTKLKMSDDIYYQSSFGNRIPIEAVIRPFWNEKIKGAIIIFKDVKKLKLIEEERKFLKYNSENILKSVYIERDNVQKEKNKLEATLNSIGDAVLTIDKEKKVVIFNPVAEKITGLSLYDIERKPYSKFLKFIDETTKREKEREIDLILNGQKKIINDYNAAMVVNNNYKKLILIDITAASIKNQNKENIGCIIVFRDVTNKREAERMRSDFISIVSHQLRTPLSAMKWFLEMLLDGDTGKLKSDQFEIIKEIYASNQGMIGFVNQMLNVSRIENDRLPIYLQEVNIDQEINKIIKEIKPILEDKGQKFKFKRLKNKFIKIKTDRNLIKSVLTSLINNASKYTADNGNILLEIEENKSFLIIKVIDNGIGIPKAEHVEIFKRFSRASNAINYNASGTGLGLYTAKSIVNLLGGKIWFESEENKGTTFFIKLPIAPAKKC